jgi:hypothetical protein
MTAQLFDSVPDAPADAVRAARETVGDLEHVLWAAKSPTDLLEVTAELEQLRSTLAAIEALTVVEIDQTDAAKAELGWASTKDYVTATSGGRVTHGPRLVKTANALAGARRATWSALHGGWISPEHADAIVLVIELLPVDTGLREEAERFLIDQAAYLNATELREAGDHLLEVLDPDGVAKREERRLDKHERSAHLNRCLSIIDDGLGGVKIHGRGTVEDAAVIRAALASLSAPAAKDLEHTDPEAGVEGRDPRDHGARTWDALVEACQRLQDAEVLPTAHGAKPRVMVFIDYEQLRSGLGTATLDTGERLSASAVKKLACDAHVIPVVLGTHSQVLDVGRTARLVTMGIWLALVARDRHCAFPGCRRPPIACDAHHITHWVDGGDTSLDGMVLLCRAHHTVIHTSDWQVRINPTDRKPEFRPPTFGRRLRPRYEKHLAASGGWIREMPPRE